MSKIKRNIIIVLVAISIILLLTNILINMLYEKENAGNDTIRISSVDSVFSITLNEFAISQDWISKKKISPKIDSITHKYVVKIPQDLLTSEIIYSLQKKFIGKDIRITSEEMSIYGNAIVKVFSNNNLKLMAELKYSNDIQRRSIKASVIIKNIHSLEPEEIEKIIGLPESLTFILNISEFSSKLKESILVNRKEYMIILNDEIDDKNLMLNSSMSSAGIKKAVINIIRRYNDNRIVLVDDKSELYSSAIFNFIRDEFKRRDVKLISKSIYEELNEKDFAKLKSKLRFIIESKAITRKIMILNAADYLNLIDEMSALRKRGISFQKLSAMNYGLED